MFKDILEEKNDFSWSKSAVWMRQVTSKNGQDDNI